ncbi:MAG TPA: hypothetical protein VHV78_02595 [Gemmatimonadaceae bacterium]|nr:hypothetical protein [Gemmatimonadaceae bacterium]
MYSTCLFCKSDLSTNDVVEHFAVGRRLAFDGRTGRLWVVCRDCGRWNLTPIEERWEAIDECERLFRGTRVRVSTDNVGLARLASGLELIRIGAPLRPEFAAWRYGRHFGTRRRRLQYVAAAGAAAAVVSGLALGPALAPALAAGALSIILVPGITTAMAVPPVLAVLGARDYLQHERVLARLTQGKRIVTVRARHLSTAEFDVSDDGGATLVVPHDTGWTSFDGVAAIHAAGVLIAGANRYGADDVTVQRAVGQIERAGDATGYLSEASRRNGWRRGRVMSVMHTYRGLGAMHLSATERLAFEMAVHEETERQAMQGELSALEAAWRDADVIASICDVDLSPPKLYESRP